MFGEQPGLVVDAALGAGPHETQAPRYLPGELVGRLRPGCQQAENGVGGGGGFLHRDLAGPGRPA